MTNLLTREIKISEIVAFLKHYFSNDRYADLTLDISILEDCELPDFEAELYEPEVELEEITCGLPEINFVSLAA